MPASFSYDCNWSAQLQVGVKPRLAHGRRIESELYRVAFEPDASVRFGRLRSCADRVQLYETSAALVKALLQER